MNFYNTSAAYFDSNALYAGAQKKNSHEWYSFTSQRINRGHYHTILHINNSLTVTLIVGIYSNYFIQTFSYSQYHKTDLAKHVYKLTATALSLVSAVWRCSFSSRLNGVKALLLFLIDWKSIYYEISCWKGRARCFPKCRFKINWSLRFLLAAYC